MTPAAARLSAPHADGLAVRSAVASLFDGLRTNPDFAASVRAWSREPVTQRFIAALDEFAITPPQVSGADEALVQYGVTQGLVLARQLLVDPSLVAPLVAGLTPAAPVLPDDSYGQDATDLA